VSENIDAIAAADEIKAAYRRYIQSQLAARDPKMDSALRAAIDTTPMLDKGPYLEATPPYAPGRSLRELVDNDVLASGFVNLASAALPLDRPLYVHQEQAIRKVAAGRNVVVATGTGSGKTESFLLPILDSLVREHERGELGPGVRALLLYPMNALANDQMKRLRQILATYPYITFGRYTGDTEQDPRKARETFAELNAGEPILSNELLSRQEMRERPPHLLLTNYAMLEYLLLRPLDMELFATAGTSRWRFIVVDEAHVYDGSQGAEIAMLLRRVRDRVAPDRPIQCIATSATVGGDPIAVTRFATNLFGEPFEWVSGDASRQDLVTAQRVAEPQGPLWGPLAARDYIQLADAHDRAAAVLQRARDYGCARTNAADALRHEKTFSRLRTLLASGAQTFARAAQALFDGEPDGRQGLAALVSLASSLRLDDGTAALAARYHLFLRATEGVYTCLSARGPHVQLGRHSICPDCAAPAFEIGSCTRCGAVHLVGSPTAEGRTMHLRPRRAGEGAVWFLLGEQAETTDEDEDAVADDATDVSGEVWKLCTDCAALCASTEATCPGCGAASLRAVRKLSKKGEEIGGCLACGARRPGTLRLFETGSDASGAVITTSLYQNLPPSPNPRERDQPGEGRKLLAFSDSRQAAAYFAPYLDDSYSRLQRRRLIVQGLLAAHADIDPVAVDDVVYTTRASAVAVKHFRSGMTSRQQAREIAPWVMAEVAATDDRLSLEGLGLVSMTLYREPAWSAPKPLRDLGLDENECWSLLQELVRTLRQQGAVTMPEEVPPNHEIFAPRLGPIRARMQGPEPVRKVLSWLPGRGDNRRIDYVRRLLATMGVDADPVRLLTGIWNFLTAPHSAVDWLRTTTEPGLGVVHQVDHERLRITWVTEQAPVYRCTLCLDGQRPCPCATCVRPFAATAGSSRLFRPRTTTGTTTGQFFDRCVQCLCGHWSTQHSGKTRRPLPYSSSSSGAKSMRCPAPRRSNSVWTSASCRQ
jgi:hypothetical protein